MNGSRVTEKGLPFRIRPFNPELDSAIVFSSFGNQVFRMSPFNKMDNSWLNIHRESVLNPIISRATTLIAQPDTDEDSRQIFAWACGETRHNTTGVLHFAYTRNPWRRHGFCTHLLKELFPRFGEDTTYFTHWSRATRHFTKKWNLVYNPYLVVGPKEK